MKAEKIYYYTEALCNTCKQRSQARAVSADGRVLLEKFCADHGNTYDVLSSDIDWFEQSFNYIKPRQIPKKFSVGEYKGCPDSCGFCPEHQQHICLPVIEISNACDLDCPVCLKNPTPNYSLSAQEFERMIDALKDTEESLDVVNISGGEPTLHPNIIEFIELCGAKSITQTTVSTNGLRLLEDAEFRRRFKQTEAVAAIQFDGFSKEAYTALRGRDLLEKKLRLLKILEDEKINYSLVATIASGVNDGEIARIADYLFESNALSLMIQPMCFTGSAESFDISRRFTTADAVRRLEESRYIGKGDFTPLPCSHYSCFALSYYVSSGEGEYRSLLEFLGKEKFLDTISNKTLPGLDYAGISIMKERLYELWSAADTSNLSENILKRIQSTIRELSSCGYDRKMALSIGMKNMKAVFIHHFMDSYNFEFGRVIKCCNPYIHSGGRFVPICAENVFL